MELCLRTLCITEINLGHLWSLVCQVSPIKGKTTKEGCSTLLSRPPFSSNIGRKKDLSTAEKHEIVECLGHVMKTLDISQKLKRDHHNVKRFVAESEHTWVRADKGTMMKVPARQIHQIKRAAAKRPLQSSKQIFEAAGASGALRTSRCRILQRLAVVHKPSIRPPLTNAHKQKRLSGPRTTWRLIFKQSCSLMSAIQPWKIQMDAVVDGWWTATMSQQGCVVSKEVVESCFEPESRGESWSASLGSLKVWKWPLQSRRTVPSATQPSSC